MFEHEQAHFFQGVSGSLYGFHLHPVSELETITPEPGLYILATSEARYPGFLVCDHTRNLRRKLANLPELRRPQGRMFVYFYASPDEDDNALEATVADITVYYRGLSHYLSRRELIDHDADMLAVAAE